MILAAQHMSTPLGSSPSHETFSGEKRRGPQQGDVVPPHGMPETMGMIIECIMEGADEHIIELYRVRAFSQVLTIRT